MTNSKEIFGRNLRNKLDAKRKKQSDLARFLGVSAVAVSRWVNGDAMPRAEMIDGICRFLVCMLYMLTTYFSYRCLKNARYNNMAVSKKIA